MVHIVIEKETQTSRTTFKRIRVCKICSKCWSTTEKYKGMSIQSSESDPVKIDTILDDVCNVFKTDKQILLGRSQSKTNTLIRHIAMYLCKDAGYSFVRIGKVFGRHHTSIIYGCRHIEQAIADDKNLRKMMLIAKLTNSQRFTT